MNFNKRFRDDKNAVKLMLKLLTLQQKEDQVEAYYALKEVVQENSNWSSSL